MSLSQFVIGRAACWAIGLVAAIHCGLVYVEMFAWTTRGCNFLSGLDPSTFEPSKILAMNVGLYNGFLAAGLIISLVSSQPWRPLLALLFLSFIALAGVFGAATADWKLLLVQTAPALLAMGLMYKKA